MPGSEYEIQVVDCHAPVAPFCQENESFYSDPLTLRTSIYGDIIGNCTVTPCTPPGGPPVNVDDILAVLEVFSSVPGAIRKGRADLEPRDLDRVINITDALEVIRAFSGLPYPFVPPSVSDPCP